MTSGIRWRVLAIGILTQATAGVIYMGLGIFVPFLRAERGLSIPEASAVLASATAGLLVGTLPWGLVADRFGDRVALGIGLLGASCWLIVAANTSDGLLPLTFGLIGLFAACSNSASGRAIISSFPPHERGMAMGVRHMAVPIGAGIGALGLPSLMDAHGLSAGFMTVSAAIAAVAVIAVTGLPPSRALPDDTSVATAVSTKATRNDHALAIISGSSLVLALAPFTFNALLVTFLVEDAGVSVAHAATAMAVVQGSTAVGRLAAGLFSDRIGRRALLIAGIGAAGALACASLAITSWLGTSSLVLACTAAVLSGTWNGLMTTMAAERAPYGRSGRWIGVQNTANYISGAAAPLIAASLASVASWGTSFAVLAAFLAMGSLMIVPLIRGEHPHEYRDLSDGWSQGEQTR